MTAYFLDDPERYSPVTHQGQCRPAEAVGRDSLESHPIASGSQDQVGARSVQVSFFPSVVEGWKEVTIGLEFLQVSVEDFPQGGIDGDGTGSLLAFGCRFSEGDRRPHVVDGQLQRL